MYCVSTEVQWVGALAWTDLTIIIATLGLYSIFGSKQFGDDTWYRALKKPPGTPKPWVFAVVWPILYGLITASIWVYWRCALSNTTESLYNLTLSLYTLQLVLNGLWIVLFFLFHLETVATINLAIVLCISIIKVVLLVYNMHGYLLVYFYLM